MQLVADVPVGAFLSGGTDSSTIVALMQAQSSRRIRTFTIGFDEAGFDEAPHPREIARYLERIIAKSRVTPTGARAVIPKLPFMYDEPLASSWPDSHKRRVRCRPSGSSHLSGDAGDEVLGGYNRYVIGPKCGAGFHMCPQNSAVCLGKRRRGSPTGAGLRCRGLPGLTIAFCPSRTRLPARTGARPDARRRPLQGAGHGMGGARGAGSCAAHYPAWMITNLLFAY